MLRNQGLVRLRPVVGVRELTPTYKNPESNALTHNSDKAVGWGEA